jgi:hypothetical protein
MVKTRARRLRDLLIRLICLRLAGKVFILWDCWAPGEFLGYGGDDFSGLKTFQFGYIAPDGEKM